MNSRLIATVGLVLALALVVGGFPAAAGPTTVTEINVSAVDAGGRIELDNSHVLVVNLESNPSTGYAWYVESRDEKVLEQVGDFALKAADKIGAPGMQILRFQGIASGQTTLNLVYRRPWEDVKPEKTFSLEVTVKAPLALPYKPEPVDTNIAPQEQETGGSVTALPSSYNWCPTYCTAVRDQGNCGSCWAFSTVGTMESVLMIRNAVTADFSEQYLVSCNADGWGCNGGWFAHDYHQWKYIVGEPGPGSVYESVFPYRASDVPCNPPHSHAYVINGWKYLSKNGVPTTNAIKNAIYNYGPVSAAVYVGSDFQGYTGGVFSTTQNGSINHAIVLTGWDDAGGYWILRNSWGSNWGVGGYMYIKYGTSQVGYAANYIW